ncbi:hypothetical protein A3Q56_03389, partial [Intoshia linei]
MSDVENILKRIQSHKGVIGLIVMNSDAMAIRTTMDNSTTVQLGTQMQSLMNISRTAVRDIDPQNDLRVMRIRTLKNELVVVRDKEHS